MNYEEIKELLLDGSKKLNSVLAREIISLWEKSPELLLKLIKEDDGSVLLDKYYCYTNEDGCHLFIRSNIKYVSKKVALKFLELQNDFVSTSFIDVTSNIVFKEEEENPVVFSWPFYTGEFLDCLTYSVVRHLIASNYFVFDFSFDLTGDVFNIFVDVLGDDVHMMELLAVNSFNIEQFLSNAKYVDKMDIIGAITLYAYSAHSFNNSEKDYGIYRKLFIRYMLYVLNTVESAKKACTFEVKRTDGEKLS